MIPQDLIKIVSDLTGIKDTQHLEKDLYLQGLISELSKSDYFRTNFAFKGGTCLTKAYLGYYRFSEDLDFTWINQKMFEKKSAKQIRKIISKELDTLIELLHKISLKHEFDFKPDKSSKKHIDFGGGNKFITFKLFYKKADGVESFIKIQANFLEQIHFPIKEKEITPIAFSFKERLDLEYPEYSEMITKKPKLFVYDLREIASEKIRATLTRNGFKARDLIDLFKLSKKGITIQEVKDSSIKKTIAMLKYEKYSASIVKKKIEDEYKLGSEANLLITPLENDYPVFIEKAIRELDLISKEIISQFKNSPE